MWAVGVNDRPHLMHEAVDPPSWTVASVIQPPTGHRVAPRTCSRPGRWVAYDGAGSGGPVSPSRAPATVVRPYGRHNPPGSDPRLRECRRGAGRMMVLARAGSPLLSQAAVVCEPRPPLCVRRGAGAKTSEAPSCMCTIAPLGVRWNRRRTGSSVDLHQAAADGTPRPPLCVLAYLRQGRSSTLTGDSAPDLSWHRLGESPLPPEPGGRGSSVRGRRPAFSAEMCTSALIAGLYLGSAGVEIRAVAPLRTPPWRGAAASQYLRLPAF